MEREEIIDKKRSALEETLSEYKGYLESAKTDKEREELIGDIKKIENELESLTFPQKEPKEEGEKKDKSNLELLKEKYEKLEEEAKKAEGARLRSREEVEDEMEKVEKEIKKEERQEKIEKLKERYAELEEEAKKTEGVRPRSVEEVEEEMAIIEKEIKRLEKGEGKIEIEEKDLEEEPGRSEIENDNEVEGEDDDIDIELGEERESAENPLLVSWRERIREASRTGEPLYVRVKRSSGEMEEGWTAERVDENGRVVVHKHNKEGERIVKRVKPEDLTEWNKEKPKEKSKEKGKEEERGSQKKSGNFFYGIALSFGKLVSLVWSGIENWAGVKKDKK